MKSHETTLFCSGGDNGAKTITWDDARDSLYLMSVYDCSFDSNTHIVESEVVGGAPLQVHQISASGFSSNKYVYMCTI